MLSVLHHPQHAVPDLAGKSAAYAKLKRFSPLLTGAARYAPETKLLGRKKAAVTARSEVPWISGTGKWADGGVTPLAPPLLGRQES